VTPPGETLEETLEAIGMSQAELAKRMGRPIKTVNEIIQAKAAITPETALQLERVLGVPASFWTNRERNYREALARQEEQERLASHVEWAKRFPTSAMIRLGWINEQRTPMLLLLELLTFFGIASPEQWNQLWQTPRVAYRRSAIFESQPEAMSAWLRKGELDAQRIQCAPFDARGFANQLQQIRTLSRQQPHYYLRELPKYCAQFGVAVVFVPTLPKAPVSGATRWLTPNKALLQLSFRHKSDDTFWFSFFHEAGHILKHGKREVFIEGSGMINEAEQEADAFAQDQLIPTREYHRLLAMAPFTHVKIEHFAESIGIAPGIVVGRLQKFGQLSHRYCNDLKQCVDDSMLVHQDIAVEV
jgi:addiction module HigA family antidote